MKARNILYFGDSIMGQKPGKGYVDLLAQYLYNKDPTTRHHPLNIGGNDSYDLLQRIEGEMYSRGEDHGWIRTILLGIGIVDSHSKSLDSTGGRVTMPEEYRHNLEKIIPLCRMNEENVIVSGITRVHGSVQSKVSGNFYNNRRIEEFDKILSSTCLEYDIPYIQMHDILKEEDYTDGLHPNDKGHRKLFRRAKQFEQFFLKGKRPL